MSATPIINKETLSLISFKLLNYSEQKAIVEILNTTHREINLLQQELQALKLQKKGLMQLLLTGIVRVNTDHD